MERINFPSGKEDQKKIAKNNVTIALIVSYHKKYMLMFQKIIQIVKCKIFF